MAVEEDLIVVFSDARPEMVALVYNRLLEAGIEAFLENEALWQAMGDLPGASIAQRVVVPDVDADDARGIVAEFQEESRAGRSLVADGEGAVAHARVEEEAGTLARTQPRDVESSRDAETEGVLREIALCPDCGKARLTVCPYCETARSDFPLADLPPAEARLDAAPLVICTVCDEPFAPRYYRRCAWCGHDFGTGREIETPATMRYLNDRVMAAIMGLALVLLAILAYFSTLLR